MNNALGQKDITKGGPQNVRPNHPNTCIKKHPGEYHRGAYYISNYLLLITCCRILHPVMQGATALEIIIDHYII